MEYANEAAYLEALEKKATLPAGFRTSTVGLTFRPQERPVKDPLPMKLNLLLLDDPTTAFAGVFTRNAFAGSPVVLGREILGHSQARGVVINNKIANVGVLSGLDDARRIQKALAALLGIDPKEIFPSSTGIIGWSLPITSMVEALPPLVEALQERSALPLARGIMTTDAYPKLRSAEVGTGRIVAVAKGAGMIEPNMATMLVFLMTDLDIDRESLREMLPRAVDQSFNAISVDSDQSTSDMAIIFSSRKKPLTDKKVFEEALFQVCRDLAIDIVRNGEGTAHVLEVHVRGAPDAKIARSTAKAVVNAPLVKTAVFGNDPNVGRILASIGDHLGNLDLTLPRELLSLKIGDQTVFENGGFVLSPEKEKYLSEYFKNASQPERKDGFPRHERNVVIRADLGLGGGSSVVYGSDLSYEYIRENADYRS